MKEEGKTFKEYCKEAKKRLKQGFWQQYHLELNEQIDKAQKQGLPVSKVKEYYTEKISGDIRKGTNENEEFYQKVKSILDNEGEISNAIGRLTDKQFYASLTYDEQQRYNLDLSEKYIKAVERYKKEKEYLAK